MLKKVELTNFKSFRKATLDFGTLTVLVGTNTSGKSNLKDALRFLHGVGLGYQFSEILGGKSGPSSVLEWRGIRGGIGEIAYDGSAEFRIGCDIVPSTKVRTYSFLRYALTVNISDRRFGPRVVRESLSTQYGYLWDSHASDDPPMQKGQHQIRIRYRRGGSYRKHGKVSECSSFLPAVAQLAFDSEAPVGAHRACVAVLEELKGIRFLDLEPDAMPEPAQLGQAVPGDKGKNLSSVLHGMCADEQLKESLLSWVRALTPLDAADFEFETAFSDRVLVYLVESGGQSASPPGARVTGRCVFLR